MAEVETPSTELRTLSADQVESFDTVYVKGERWDLIHRRLGEAFGDGFEFLDIGGGNGVFADRLLEAFPRSRGVLLDTAEGLLARNTANPRKETVCGSAEHLATIFDGRRFDVIHYNWVLHHLVTGSFRGSLEQIRRNLGMAADLLTPTGRISVFENLPTPLLFDRLPSRLIYGATSSRLLARLSSFAGANTGGVGVCYLSRRHWYEVFAEAGLEVEHFHEFTGSGSLSPVKNLLLVTRHGVPRAHFWCRRKAAGSQPPMPGGKSPS